MTLHIEWMMVGMAVMLLLCLVDMPWGYYNLVRFVAMVGFGILCYDYWQKGGKEAAVACGAAALLFQPFAKVDLGRDVWAWVDVVAAALLVWLLIKRMKKKE